MPVLTSVNIKEIGNFAYDDTNNRWQALSLDNGNLITSFRDRLTDNIGVAIQTDVIMDDATALIPKFAIISASTSGANTIVTAVSGKKIRVLSYNFIANGNVNAKWQSNTTDISGLKYCTQYSGLVANFNPVGWVETASGEALKLNLSAAIAIGGEITYIEI